MKKIKLIFLVAYSLLLLSCETIKKGLGLEKNNPNDFLVEKRQSILMPPDYELFSPDSKIDIKKNTKDQNLESVFNNQLNKNIKSDIENKNTNKSKAYENEILNMIK